MLWKERGSGAAIDLVNRVDHVVVVAGYHRSKKMVQHQVSVWITPKDAQHVQAVFEKVAHSSGKYYSKSLKINSQGQRTELKLGKNPKGFYVLLKHKGQKDWSGVWGLAYSTIKRHFVSQIYEIAVKEYIYPQNQQTQSHAPQVGEQQIISRSVFFPKGEHRDKAVKVLQGLDGVLTVIEKGEHIVLIRTRERIDLLLEAVTRRTGPMKAFIEFAG